MEKKNAPHQKKFPFNIHHPFDGFAKYVFGDPDFMRLFLLSCISRGDIPKAWFRHGVPTKLTCIKTNYVKEDLSQEYIDLLFCAANGEDGSNLYIHLEIAVALKGDELRRLHGYKGHVFRYAAAEQKNRKVDNTGLAPVLQIFLYIGPECKKSKALVEHAKPSQQLDSGADYSVAFVPLDQHTNETLLENNITGPAEVLMKHAPKRKLLAFFKENPNFVARLREADYWEVAAYLMGALEPKPKRRRKLLRLFLNSKTEKVEDMMTSFLNPAVGIIQRESKREGKREGIQQMILSMAAEGVSKALLAKGAKRSVSEIESILVAG